MIPRLVTVRHRRHDGRWRRLYVPVAPVLVLVSPLLAVAVLAGLVACAVARINPVAALHAAGRLLCALPGTRIEIEQGRTSVLVSVR